MYLKMYCYKSNNIIFVTGTETFVNILCCWYIFFTIYGKGIAFNIIFIKYSFIILLKGLYVIMFLQDIKNIISVLCNLHVQF